MIPLQIEETLSSLSFQNGVPIDLSPDGKWVAYTLKDPRRGEKIDDERYSFFTRLGVRIFEVSCDIWVTNAASGESKCLTGGEGNSWGPCGPPMDSISYSTQTGTVKRGFGGGTKLPIHYNRCQISLFVLILVMKLSAGHRIAERCFARSYRRE